jgi:hypothetical protein
MAFMGQELSESRAVRAIAAHRVERVAIVAASGPSVSRRETLDRLGAVR